MLFEIFAGVKRRMKTKRNTWIITLIAALLTIWGVPAKVSLAAPAPRPRGQAATGEVTGKILFEGTRPHLPQISMAQDPECARELQGKTVYPQDGMVNPDGTLPNVFVYVKSGAQGHYATPRQAVTLDQKGCTYVPHVLGVMAGQSLKFVNTDFTTHNIHVMPKNNPQWNQSQPPGAAPFYKKFAHAEIMIPVHCNEHPWMKAYIGVVTNPFYAVTGKGGTFTLKGLPAGEYTIEAWTATFGTQQTTVTVPAHGSATADFTFRAQ